MKLNKFLEKYWFVIIAIIVLVLIFYPKYCGYTYGGFVKFGDVLHREECSCFGYKYNSMYHPLEQLTSILTGQKLYCTDCGSYYFCIGIPYEKKCYESIADQATEKEIPCG